jgi:hypothetical protein
MSRARSDGGNAFPRQLGALIFVLVCATVAAAQSAASSEHKSTSDPLPAGSWRFIVSGDSRNCGDIVMPAIAAHSVQFAPSFYWHLGDLRAIYKVDEDMAFAAAVDGEFLSCSLYLQRAWPDFIEHQIAAFGNVPYYVGIGNHEVITPKDRFQFRRQFAAWLDQSTLHEQRAADDPAAQKKAAPVEPEAPPTYFHWVQNKVDFIYLDNSSDCFLPAELDWLKRVLEKDASNSDPKHEVKSVVVGMHEALPDSLANSHSMGESRVLEARPSGEKAYEMLRLFRDQNHKPVYVLSSHSHVYMENIFDTPELRKKGEPLPGWIVGTGGAERAKLPVPASEKARQDVYGYLVGTVAADGTIQFGFQEIQEADVPPTTRRDYPATLVHWCFAHNSQNTDPGAGEITPHCAPPPPPPKCE